MSSGPFPPAPLQFHPDPSTGKLIWLHTTHVSQQLFTSQKCFSKSWLITGYCFCHQRYILCNDRWTTNASLVGRIIQKFECFAIRAAQGAANKLLSSSVCQLLAVWVQGSNWQMNSCPDVLDIAPITKPAIIPSQLSLLVHFWRSYCLFHQHLPVSWQWQVSGPILCVCREAGEPHTFLPLRGLPSTCDSLAFSVSPLAQSTPPTWKMQRVQKSSASWLDLFQASWRQAHPMLKLPHTAEGRTLLYSAPHEGESGEC